MTAGAARAPLGIEALDADVLVPEEDEFIGRDDVRVEEALEVPPLDLPQGHHLSRRKAQHTQQDTISDAR